MTKLFFTISSFFLLLFFLNSCDDYGTKIRKKDCEKFVTKNSIDYKNCISSTNYYFVYGLEKDLKRIEKEINYHNKLVELVNSIEPLVKHEEYEEVDFELFLDQNFSDSFFLTLKNKEILNKKIRFKTEFYDGLDDNNDDTIHLSKYDPNDYHNSLWFLKAPFYDIRIKEKLLYPKKQKIYWMGTTRYTDNEVFGIFYQSPGSYGSDVQFFIQDIKLDYKKYDRKTEIDYLVEQHAATHFTKDKTVGEVESEVRSLINQILK